jgi:hypothetical protein
MDATKNMWPYVKQFCLVYTPVMIAGFAVLTLLDINGNSGLSIGLLMGCSVWPAQRFVRDHQRLMSKGERARFALGAMLMSLLISALVAAVGVIIVSKNEGLTELAETLSAMIAGNPAIAAFAVMAALLISWFTIYIGAGMFGRQLIKTLPPPERRDPPTLTR